MYVCVCWGVTTIQGEVTGKIDENIKTRQSERERERSGHKKNSLFLGWKLFGIDTRRLVARLLAAGAVPIAEHPNGDGKEHIGYDQRKHQMVQIVLPRVATDNDLRIGATVVAGEGLSDV